MDWNRDLKAAVRTFKRLSGDFSANIVRMSNALDGKTSLSDMIEQGVITSVYDCLPEFRTSCFKALRVPNSPTTKSIIYGCCDWVDAYHADPHALSNFVSEHLREAADLGFNLFSYREFGYDLYVERYYEARGLCRISQNAKGEPVSEEDSDLGCKALQGFYEWLKANNYCWDKSELYWRDCNSNQYNSRLEIPQKFKLNNRFTLNETCIVQASSIFGLGQMGSNFGDKIKQFTLSVREDGTVDINGQTLKPKYVEHLPNGSLRYTSVSAIEFSNAVEGKLQMMRNMPGDYSAEADAMEKFINGIMGNALGDRNRIFLINIPKDAFVFADVVDDNLTNIAAALCE